MPSWSVALFGHHKPKFYLRSRESGIRIMDFVDKPTEEFWASDLYYLYNVHGWERRAEAGDIIAIRPIEEENRWTDLERSQFLIVTLTDFELSQLSGTTEPYWDESTYPDVPPDVIRKLQDKGEVIELMPSMHLKKRRFHVPLDDLRDQGVDIDKMLDKNKLYDPRPEIGKKKCYDKFRGRYASKQDRFNLLTPRRIGAVK